MVCVIVLIGLTIRYCWLWLMFLSSTCTATFWITLFDLIQNSANVPLVPLDDEFDRNVANDGSSQSENLRVNSSTSGDVRDSCVEPSTTRVPTFCQVCFWINSQQVETLIETRSMYKFFSRVVGILALQVSFFAIVFICLLVDAMMNTVIVTYGKVSRSFCLGLLTCLVLSCWALIRFLIHP